MCLNRKQQLCKYTGWGGPWHLLQGLHGEQSAKVSKWMAGPVWELSLAWSTRDGHKQPLSAVCCWKRLEVTSRERSAVNGSLTGLLILPVCLTLTNLWTNECSNAPLFGSVPEGMLSVIRNARVAPKHRGCISAITRLSDKTLLL